MNSSSSTVNDNEILSRAVNTIDGRQLEPIAGVLAKLRLPESDLNRVDELLGKKGESGLDDAEESELESYMRVGSFLDMIRARAVRILSE